MSEVVHHFIFVYITEKALEALMNTRLLKHFRNYPVGYALLAAILFGLNAPLSKLLLSEIPPLFMAAFLYLGAGAGMLLLHCFSVEKKRSTFVKKGASVGSWNDSVGCCRAGFADVRSEIHFCCQCIIALQL